MPYGYPDLTKDGWKPGVHKRPNANYQHPWLCVVRGRTTGHWIKRDAQAEYRQVRQQATN